jgi:hypothetical protein
MDFFILTHPFTPNYTGKWALCQVGKWDFYIQPVFFCAAADSSALDSSKAENVRKILDVTKVAGINPVISQLVPCLQPGFTGRLILRDAPEFTRVVQKRCIS